MTELTYEQICFGCASGEYLSEQVDETFWQLSQEDQYEYLENNAWEPFENYEGKDISEWIWLSAYASMNKQIPIMEENQ